MIKMTGTTNFIKDRADMVATRIRDMSQSAPPDLTIVDARALVGRIEMLEAQGDQNNERAEWYNLAQKTGDELGGYGHMWDDDCGLVARARKMRERAEVAEVKAGLSGLRVVELESKLAHVSTKPAEYFAAQMADCLGFDSVPQSMGPFLNKACEVSNMARRAETALAQLSKLDCEATS